jgi:NADPH:quinone reductase
MHATVVRDGRLVWEERADPEPGDTELLVAVKAAGVNRGDLLQRQGLYPAPPGAPADIPGLELAGEVRAVGSEVTRHSVGDRVMAVVGGGGQATMAAVDETHAIAVPVDVPWAEAGGFPEVFSTAYDALFTQCALTTGERALVTGAAGGVGTAGVQLAAAGGATVVACVKDPAHGPALKSLGASEVIDVGSIPDAGPYDVVLELVGAPSLAPALGALATGGRVSVIGVGGGSRVELNLLQLMAARARISGSTLRARDTVAKAVVAQGVDDHVVPLLRAGRVRVPVAATYPMSDAEAAYERFAAGGKLGKIVLTA